ncbi:MAG: serine/threonine protein phosphatase [Ruminococcaceae bacterium]|nr:serine/threonine protein phosphatase [Oscillospiraceae bacterium]
MSLYAIGDLHLSFTADNPMDIFGDWEGYVNRLREGFSVVTDDDTTVLLGDLSWGIDLNEAKEDFRFISQIPGRKIIIKGNHDYWWSTAKKMNAFFEENGFENIEILHNNCLYYEDIALCGTRGWFYELDGKGDNSKVYNREIMRLETSLKAAGDSEKICFFHYPPKYRNYSCPDILRLMVKYDVKSCYYGHLHAESRRLAIEGLSDTIDFHLVSADHVGFKPVKIK